MSLYQLKASASISFTLPGMSDEMEHLLAVPFGVMQAFQPSRRVRTFDWWSDNFENRRTVTVGTGVHDLIVTHRLENQPIAFMDWLEAALLYDIVTTYRVFASGLEFPFRVVEQIGTEPDSVSILPDRQRWGGNDWETAFRMRRTDGGTFDGLYPDSVLSG